MRSLKYLLLLAVLAAPAAYSHAQVAVAVQFGPPPVCEFGYYPYTPYACAPYGYWGPEWFADGFFIGVGPWYRYYYRHPEFFVGGYGPGWHRFGHDRDFDRGRGFAGRGFSGRDGFQPFNGRRADNGFRGGQSFRGGTASRDGNRFQGRSFQGGGSYRGGGNYRGSGYYSGGGNSRGGGSYHSSGGSYHGSGGHASGGSQRGGSSGGHRGR
jgi:hypothetical protein